MKEMSHLNQLDLKARNAEAMKKIEREMDVFL